MTTAIELENIRIAPVIRKRFRVDEFHKMMEAGILPEESGWEVIDGDIYKEMSIGKKHASLVARIDENLRDILGKSVTIFIQNPIHLDDFNEPEPDILVLKRKEDFYLDGLPTPPDVLLLIEVSDSTLEYDREVKKKLYAEAGIVEFWIVNLVENTVEVYSQPKNGNYRLSRILEIGESVKATAIENLEMTVEEILGL